MISIDEILNKICLDERISEGVFFMEDNGHMDILQEFLIKTGLNEEDSVTIRNKMVEGRYPERQAYNSNGLLVTFPTPEYKQRAIQRGTHFEVNPKKAQANVFQKQPADTTPPQPQPQPSAPTARAPVATPTVTPVTTQPEQPTPLDAEEEPAKDERTPEEKAEDAKAVEMMLSDAPATVDISKNYPNISEKISFTLKEAKYCNFYEKNGTWFNNEGKYIGKKWYCENSGQILIIP
jgi:hypothetical protein